MLEAQLSSSGLQRIKCSRSTWLSKSSTMDSTPRRLIVHSLFALCSVPQMPLEKAFIGLLEYDLPAKCSLLSSSSRHCIASLGCSQHILDCPVPQVCWRRARILADLLQPAVAWGPGLWLVNPVMCRCGSAGLDLLEPSQTDERYGQTVSKHCRKANELVEQWTN